MSTKLYLSIDLGGDTIKICFGFRKDNKEYIGKIVNSNSIFPDPIPATAYYDEDTKKWYFGEDIDAVSSNFFLTVVKIKKLLGLLIRDENKAVFEGNREYYLNGNHFPKFYFPDKQMIYKSFHKMIDFDMTFVAPGFTPQSVCEKFFIYISNLVADEVNKLREKYSIEFNDISLSVVTPTYYGRAYNTELKKLISTAFGHDIDFTIDATRAMCFSAYQQGILEENDRALVFDMGEEKISVVKANMIMGEDQTYVGIDAEDAHSKPIEIGGATLDENIIEYLTGNVSSRIKVGEQETSKQEVSLDSKQYLLVKNVKQAKMLLSDERYKNEEYSVPISVWEEVRVLKNLDKSELRNTTKIFASKIISYVLDEIQLAINYDVNKIIFSGGLIESLGLFDMLKYSIHSKYPDITTLKIEHEATLNNEFDVLEYEDSVYSAALGGIKANFSNHKIKTILPYTYGTWGNKSNNRILEVYDGAIKGRILEEKYNEFEKNFTLGSSGKFTYEIQEEVYSIILHPKDIQRKLFWDKLFYYTSANGSNYLVIGKIGSIPHNKAKDAINLTLVAGGEKGKILFYVGNQRVSIYDRIKATTVLHIDSKGHCIPTIKNNDTSRHIKYIVGQPSNYNSNHIFGGSSVNNSTIRTISANKIVIKYAGVEEFDQEEEC